MDFDHVPKYIPEKYNDFVDWNSFGYVTYNDFILCFGGNIQNEFEDDEIYSIESNRMDDTFLFNMTGNIWYRANDNYILPDLIDNTTAIFQNDSVGNATIHILGGNKIVAVSIISINAKLFVYFTEKDTKYVLDSILKT